MHLVWFEVHGFKRFASPTKLNVDGKLIAIVGPNEGGKTSLLKAFQHMNTTEPVARSGPSQETTRGLSFEAEHDIIEATYYLDEDDRKALAHVPEASDVRWYSVTKKVEGDSFYITQRPQPKRNLVPRYEVLSDIENACEQIEQASDGTEEEEPVLALDELKVLLSSEDENLDIKQVSTLNSFADRIETYCEDYGAIGCDHLPTLLRELADHESKEHPEDLVRETLWKRRPRFLKFTDDDRLLRSQYSINSFFRNAQGQPLNQPSIPQAINNLATACNLNLQALFDARVVNDEGEVESLLDDANEELKRLMGTWSQSNVTVRLTLNQFNLNVLIGQTGERFVQIAERSDGLRQFVALLMFLSREPDLSVPPILLIDEAERHLHYDAQADLVQMLARQNVAAKVIYTTHSLGCLPEDLGTGVRLVKTVEPSHSKVVNWFWDSDTPGFSRLLFGMGASTLAFIPVRFAVLTEGAADMLLLPSLLRASSESDYLGFQVAPGLSSATTNQLAIVDNEAPRTVFLTDSDQSGLDLRSKVLEAGIPEERVLSLPKIGDVGSVIEDFVDPEAYVRAINFELKRSHGDRYEFLVEDLPVANRPLFLKEWCEEHSISAPSKRAVAYNILETKNEHPLVFEERRTDLVGFLRDIKECLDLK